MQATTDPRAIEAMLLQSARLSVAIDREYLRTKADVSARYYTYVLQLQGGKFYVGNTDNLYRRMLDHHRAPAASARWVALHGPVVRVVEVCRDSRLGDEHYKTMLYMTMFGWQHVRGGNYCNTIMHSPPDALDRFTRSPDRDFRHLARREIDEVMARVRELSAAYEDPSPPQPRLNEDADPSQQRPNAAPWRAGSRPPSSPPP
jgi:hypothetical protein